MAALIVFGGVYLIYGVLAAACIAWMLLPTSKQTRYLIVGVVAAIITVAAAVIASALFSHPQPFATTGVGPLISHEIDNAFPSHHTLFAALAASVVFLFKRWLGTVLFVAAVAIGVSRIAAGLHYPVDILTSLALAVAGAFAAIMLISRFYPDVLESGD